MKVISQANENVLVILNRFLKADFSGRLMKYCVEMETEDGVLLFNLLTREMVLLNEEEYRKMTELDYLRKRWFVVPEQLNEKECVEFVRLILKAKTKTKGEITGYTIFPTTDCNARCFYCFELGRSRIPMSRETAEKVADYIKTHCGGKKVSISWFGGEPLMNQEAIDIICGKLRRNNIELKSRMVTNGYLFDDATAEKAVKDWNLKKVQITLDGTETVYNRIKAYVYQDNNPYQIVLHNIERLLNLGVKVAVRLNMDLHNADDLMHLVDELAARFSSKENFMVYAHHLFQEGCTNADIHSEEEWQIRSDAMSRLREKILSGGLAPKGTISQKVKLNRCMADHDGCITILPDGNIGVCEHYSESEFIGHIDREGFDDKMVASWKQTIPELAECAGCFYFPECIKLKKCMSENSCYPVFRQEQLQKTKEKMFYTYQAYLHEGVQKEEEEEDDSGHE